MACSCVICPDCNGSGSLWLTMDGEIDQIRCDDMGELTTCDSCRGSGYIERCEECEEFFGDDDELRY